MRASHSF
jgi:hypothetical protein